MLALYRAGLRLRRSTPGLGDGDLTWIPSSGSVLAFSRGNHFLCLVNFGADAVDLPDGADVLLASSELEGGALPHDSTVWLRQANPHSIG
jgi:alpha-glucosidase